MSDGLEKKDGWIARAAVFGVLWFVSAFYFLGDLGKWADDWMFHVRDPVTGTFKWGDIFAPDPLRTGFWRPLHIHLSIFLDTLLWSHDGVIHSIQAALHGLNAWLVWKVLGQVCTSRQAPAIGAILFLVYPAAHEAIFWLSTIGTTVGLGSFLVCVLGVQRFASGEIGWRGLLLHLPLLLTLGWWYEQSAACGPAIAFAYLAAVTQSVPWKKRFGTATGFVVAAFAGGIVYAALLLQTIAPQARGGSQSINHAAELIPQTRLVVGQAWQYLTLTTFASGALREGWSGVRSRPLEAIGVGVVLVLALPGFSSWWMRGRAVSSAVSSSADVGETKFGTRRAWAIVFGASIMLASMVPVIAVHNQWFAPRLAYHTLFGILVVVAVLIDVPFAARWGRARDARGRVWRGGSLGVFMPVAICFAIMLVGVQSVWHKRQAAERRMTREFRELVPNPPINAVFVPIRVASRPTNTGSGAFDNIGTSPFEFHWSASQPIQFMYARADVRALGISQWLAPGKRLVGCEGATESDLVLSPECLPRAALVVDAKGRKLVPWSSVVAFQIEKGGHVRLVDSIRVETPENPAMDRLIQLAAYGDGKRSDRAVFAGLVDALPGWGAPPTQLGWKLMDANGSVPADRAEPAAQVVRDQMCVAFTMHPRVETITERHVITAQLPVSERVRTVAMRVAMPEYVLGESDGVEVALYLDGLAEPIARELVTPERLKREGKWIVVRGEVRPLGVSQRIKVVVSEGPAGNPNYDWCFVTPPVVVEGEAGAAGK